MTDPPQRAAGDYLRFLLWVVAATAVLLLVGYVPTRRLGGEEGLPAMIAGCAVGALASAIGGLPVLLIRGGSPAARVMATMGSMALRLFVVAILAVAVALSGLFERVPLLIWIAVSYAVLLIVDTRYALRSQSAGKNVET